MHARNRVSPPLAIPIVAGALLPGGGPALANVALTQLSSDPYTNPASQHRTEVEPDTFAAGNTIVSAFQVGRFVDGGASGAGFAISTNAGSTWTHGFLSGVEGKWPSATMRRANSLGEDHCRRSLARRTAGDGVGSRPGGTGRLPRGQ
jgi:hypothetical protein